MSMNRKLEFRVLLILGALFLVPASMLAQKSGPPFPREGAARVQDNDRIVAWDVTYEKGRPTGMVKLDMDQVTVTLTDGAIKIKRPDGTWSIEQERLGSVRYEPKGTVVDEEGVSDVPSRAMVFQLRDYVPDPWPTREGVAAQFPRINTVKLFETDRIVIWDQVWKPGEQVTRHAHYHRTAAVFLEGGALHTISDSGVVNPSFTRKPGEVISTTKYSPEAHIEEEVTGLPRAIWIEFIK
jgi:hypothetical protein